MTTTEDANPETSWAFSNKNKRALWKYVGVKWGYGLKKE